MATLQPPDPAPADAPATEFSAGGPSRTSRRSRPGSTSPGSAASDRVVEGLVATLSGLGLDTRVQNAVGRGPHRGGETRMARVRNVVAVLPGHRPHRPAVPHRAPRLGRDRARGRRRRGRRGRRPRDRAGADRGPAAAQRRRGRPHRRRGGVLLRRGGVRGRPPARRRPAAWSSTWRPAAPAARRSCSRRRRATPPSPRRTPPPCRTRWRAASPSRSTGRCRTSPTSAC